MKKVVLILMAAFIMMLPGTVLAMKFSEPVKLDSKLFSFYQILKISDDKLYFDMSGKGGAVRVYVTPTGPRSANNELSRFNLNFGSIDDKSNTVPVGCGYKTTDVYEISGDNNKFFYVILDHSSDGFVFVNIIGKYGNKFVKYINSNPVRSDGVYCGRSGNNFNFSVQGDTLVLSCYDDGKMNPANPYERRWQHILKWDDAAQWFGIENREL